MPPLEDELRATLQGRATTLTPPADPFVGVEQRARGLRRRRTAASVAGTALAVLAVVGAVPLVTSPEGSAPGVVATAAPTALATNPYALDLDDPWPYRGDPAVRDEGLAAWQREWQVRHPGADLVPLFGQVWEPGGQPELVFASRLPGSDRYWVGIAQTGEAGPVFRTVERSGAVNAVVLVLPGDEGDRLLVVASPDAERLQYAADGSRFEDLAPLADAVGTVAVQRAPDTSDQYQVVGRDGLLLEQGAVDDEPVVDPAEPVVTEAPGNVVDWPVRGVPRGEDVLRARELYAADRGVPADEVSEKVLFAGSDDAGRHYLLAQLWVPGDAEAGLVGLLVPAQGEPELQLKRALQPGAAVAAMYLSPPNEQSRGELLVVPRPGTGQVLYAGDDATEWAPKDTTGLDGVVLLGRSPQAERGEAEDRIRLLDGDGVEITTVPVRDLLCGTTTCS